MKTVKQYIKNPKFGQGDEPEFIPVGNTGIDAVKNRLLQVERQELNLTIKNSKNYSTLTEAIADVTDDKYKFKGFVLTFNNGTEWVSKRYNGADASGFATEDNWVETGGSIQETDWTPFNVIINKIIKDSPSNISEQDYNTLKSFLKEPDKFYYPSLYYVDENSDLLLFANLYKVSIDSSNTIGILYTANMLYVNYCYIITISESRDITSKTYTNTIRALNDGLTISSSDTEAKQQKSISIKTSGDGTKFLSDNGQYKEITTGTQYLDLSMFSEESGTLSEENYQKVVKAYEDKINVAFLDTATYPLSIQKSDNIYMLGVSIVSDDEMGHNFLTLSSILIVEKNYTQTSSFLSVIVDGSGTKALTDNGQYAEFASPIKTQDGGTGAVTKELQPNTFYKFGECSSLTITLAAEKSGILNEYMFEFISGSTPTTLTDIPNIKWQNGDKLAPEANYTYQISIVNNCAVYAKFPNA